jgi:glyoxylase I family protein
MKIHHLALRTRDLPRLRAFYADVLGLSVLEEKLDRSVWLDARGTIVMLERAEESEPLVAAGSLDLVAFAIEPEDEDRLEARLVSNGVAIEGRTDFTLYFRDPDGRRIGASHYPQPRRDQ